MVFWLMWTFVGSYSPSRVSHLAATPPVSKPMEEPARLRCRQSGIDTKICNPQSYSGTNTSCAKMFRESLEAWTPVYSSLLLGLGFPLKIQSKHLFPEPSCGAVDPDTSLVISCLINCVHSKNCPTSSTSSTTSASQP